MSKFQDDQKIRQMTEAILGEIVFRAIHGSTKGAENVARRIFNLESRLEDANAEIARLRSRLPEAWTPISVEPDEIDVPYLVATLDGRVGTRVWCRDSMGNAPEFYLRDEDDIQAYRGEIAYWRKIIPPAKDSAWG